MTSLRIVVLNYKTKDLTLSCLDSIFSKQWEHEIHIYLVDNASGDNVCDEAKKRYPKLQIIKSLVNLGFSGGNNLALKEVSEDWVLLLNSDTILSEGSLDLLLNEAEKEKYDIASCKLVSPDNLLQFNAGYLPTFGPLLVWLSGLDDLLRKVLHLPSYQERDKNYYLNNREVGWVSGTAMLIKSEVIDKIGKLDENIFMYGEDVEYCFRANLANFRVGWIKGTSITHLGGASSHNPQFNQWRGEFKGLLYLYNKYYGWGAGFILRVFLSIFILVRMAVFAVIGKLQFSKTYAKVLISL